MKYKLETIPVWDALKEDSECLLCFLRDKIEDYYLNYYLGSSVMNPETRVRVNESAFCPTHFQGLLGKKKAHGLGLLTHTHMVENGKTLNPLLQTLESLGQKTMEKPSGGNKKNLQKAMENLSEWIEKKEESCLVCDGINRTMDRYAFTLAWLWKDEEEFREAFRESRGICLHHMPLQLRLAAEALKPEQLGSLMQALAEVELKNMDRIEGELLWFTQKFDAQNANKDWGNSKDAHYRSIQKLTGKKAEQE